VFARFGRPPVPLVPLVLDHNLRNTRQITETFLPLAPMRMYARGGEGPDVTYVEASAEDALDTADDQIDPLLDDGWRPEDVALLTTGTRHPEQVSLQESEGQVGSWRTLALPWRAGSESNCHDDPKMGPCRTPVSTRRSS
jgi:hypothetical protein